MPIVTNFDKIFHDMMGLFLAAMLGMFVWLCSLLPKQWRIIIGGIGALALTFQLAAVYANGQFINERFWANFSPAILWQTRHFYFWDFTYFILCSLTTWFVIIIISKNLEKWIKKRVFFWLFGVICTIPMGLPNSPIMGYFQSFNWLMASKEPLPFDQALQEVGITPSQYVKKPYLHAKPGKNILVISLESFEMAYLQDSLKVLSPNIQRIAKEHSLYPMEALPGSDWTAASIYTMLTGVPAYFTTPGNAIFQQSHEHQLVSVPYVLKKAGYQIEYIIGNPTFGGLDDLLKSFDFIVISEKDYPSLSTKTDWGLHDFDAFSIAKQRLLQLSKTGKPFALFMSTISTHPPSGVYDDRVTQFVSKRKSTMETMAAALDHHIGDLMSFLQEEKLLDETVVYIMPDHLLIGKAAPILAKFDEQRALFLLSTAKDFKVSSPLYQVMLPSIILQNAGITHNATFWTDFVESDQIPQLIHEKKEALRQLNIASLQRYGYGSGITAQLKSKNHLLIKSVDGKLQETLVFNNNDTAFLLVFDYEMRLDKARKIAHNEMSKINLEPGQIGFFVQNTHNGISGTLKAWNQGILHKTNNNQITINSYEIDSLKKLQFTNNNKATSMHDYKSITSPKLLKLAHDRTRFIAHAGGSINGKSYTNSLDALTASYNNGFRYFELDIQKTSDGFFVATHDWETWKEQSNYSGKMPVSHASFMEQKIYGQYAPLDMSEINDWFKAHSDAVLITDKINEPVLFSSQFIDKQRLMMELFTWDSVKTALKLNIKQVLPSEPLLYEIEGDKLQYLIDQNIKAITLSRRSFSQHLDYYKFLKSQGIEVYLFHVNHDLGKDEMWVLENELPFAKGMYADNWNFQELPKLNN